jgi:acylphosphatase
VKKTLCLRCLVTGRVQGVGFRYATAEKAEALGVTGYVRNLPDRRVEVLACGEEKAVTALRDWLWQGPQLARVSDVRHDTLPHQDFRDFRIV